MVTQGLSTQKECLYVGASRPGLIVELIGWVLRPAGSGVWCGFRNLGFRLVLLILTMVSHIERLVSLHEDRNRPMSNQKAIVGCVRAIAHVLVRKQTWENCAAHYHRSRTAAALGVFVQLAEKSLHPSFCQSIPTTWHKKARPTAQESSRYV